MAEKPPSYFKTLKDRELIQSSLKKSPFFNCLDTDQVERFIDALHIESFREGSIIIQEGCIDGTRTLQTRPTILVHDIYSEGSHTRKAIVSEIPSDSGNDDNVESNATDEARNEYQDRPAGSEDNHTSTKDREKPLPKFSLIKSDDDGDAQDRTAPPSAPLSGQPRRIYILRGGKADVWYDQMSPASLEQGRIFGEGGFLFGRQHSASVITSSDVECWVLDFDTFRRHVLPSAYMRESFERYAVDKDSNDRSYLKIEKFVESTKEGAFAIGSSFSSRDPQMILRIARMFNLLDEHERIYLEDFCFLHLLLDRPDPEIDIAFLLMDSERKGQIGLKDVKAFLQSSNITMSLDSEVFRRYFGTKKLQRIRQMQFPQFFLDLQREMGRQAFQRALDIHGNEGYLATNHFIRVLTNSCGWQLPLALVDRLGVMFQTDVEEERSQSFAYGDFVAMQDIFMSLPAICNMIETAERIKESPITVDDFIIANRAMGLGQLSRRQVELIFHLFDTDKNGFIGHQDTVNVCGLDFVRPLVKTTGKEDRLVIAPTTAQVQASSEKEFVESSAGEVHTQANFPSITHIGIIALSSLFGPLLLYPFDLVKTRMMNQRLDRTRLYNSFLDCLQTSVRNEGYGAVYRGITPQLIGVIPEQFIKLQVNNFFRHSFGVDGTCLEMEFLAGAATGACQLLVTNPMELVKIRLQLQGETASLLRSRGLIPPKSLGLLDMVKDLGYSGLLRGASACLLRDIPFSAIYFTGYAFTKDLLRSQHGGTISPSDIFIAGTAAAIPATILTTPADTVKTRLQAIPRPGESSYTGVRDCAMTMYSKEGLSAFFQGAIPRALRLAPQFGVSLFAYETLRSFFGIEVAPGPPTNAYIVHEDYRQAFG